MTDKPSKTTSTTATLRSVLETIIPFTAAIYIIGFVVANSYYSTLGITEYQLVQARYVGAGLTYLFFHLGIAAMVALVVLAVGRASAPVWLFVALGLWGFLGATIYFVGESISAVLAVGVNVGFILFLGYQAWRLWGGRHRTAHGVWIVPREYRDRIISYGVPQQSISTVVGIILTFLVCASAITWGQSFWPIVTSTLGGGRPSEAVFVFEAESSLDAHLAFVPMQNESVSKQLPVLFENSDHFVVLIELDSGSPAAIQLSKSIVHSVLYAPSGLVGQKQVLPTLTPAPTSPSTQTPTPSLICTPIPPTRPTTTSSPMPAVVKTPTPRPSPTPTEAHHSQVTVTP